MKSILLIFFLFNFLILINSIQTQKTTRYYSYQDEAYIWNLIDNLTGISVEFGVGVSIYEDVLAIGYIEVMEYQLFVYRYNGTNFELEQTFNENLGSSFKGVSVYENVIVVGAPSEDKVFVYRYNGSIWNLEQTLNGTSGFGYDVSVYENVTVVSVPSEDQVLDILFQFMEMLLLLVIPLKIKVFVYRYNGSIWNFEQTLNGTEGSGFGYSVSVYENVLVVGSVLSNQAFAYRYNESIWNLEEIWNETENSYFGSAVSVYENVIVIGASHAGNAFVYRYNEPIWNLEEIWNETGTLDSDFGKSVSVYGNFTAIGSPYNNRAYVYQVYFIPQVNIHNCSSLFSSFDCYWDKIECELTLKYQINFGYDWIDIDSPILEDGNVLYQLFNYSFDSNITGNEYYSIQIQACDIESLKCGISSFVNLTTKIDSVKNFQLLDQTSYSINISWNPPNVSINEEIAHLDHYNLSYFNSSAPESISSISIDNSSTSYILDIECGNDYNISICGCRTQECEGEDQGEVVESSISIQFEDIEDFTCLIQYSLDINCSWNQPINCSIPSYYNFTYQAISQSYSGNYNLTSSNQYFTNYLQNQEYQINVSACNSINKCSNISTTSVTTENLTTSPTIYQTISKIEEIELNFTKLTNANNYSISISLNNETNWQNFTSLDLSGMEVIGTISGISGNIEYNISIRGCADLNCKTEYLGEPSSFTLVTPKLGNITSLSCSSLLCGFECNWDSLNLSDGLKAYSFRYNSTTTCLSNSTTNYPVLGGLIPSANYEISVYSSATSNCSYNEYSGIETTTIVTTDNLPAPTIYQTISKIEEIELNFTKLTNANNYSISISLNNETNWQNFTSLDLSGMEVIGTINGLSGNIEYNISIRGCVDLNCKPEYLGEPSSFTLETPKLGNITSLSCSSLSCGFECNWDSLNLSDGLKAYSFRYNSTTICLSNSTTNYSVLGGLIPSANYEISVYSSATSNCSYNEYSGIETTTTVTTDNLPAPTINQLNPKIEEIEIIFTKVTNAQNYSISLNNETNWQNFTTLDLSGNEGIGTISGISGNIEYNISIRGCSDLNCKPEYLGESSLINSTIPKLGNITSLNCYGIINGFVFSGVNGEENYEISVYSSATSNCDYNEYSGIKTTTIVTTLSPTQTSESTSKTPIIAMGVIIPILVIGGVIGFIILIRKQKTSIKRIIKEREKELEKSGGIEMI
ncbi:hypothetical protein M0811_03156 [Anaeramoeba ignava]|uniref:Fibronectin type-III domain-containing protein n=1 Tax=Anaeramoeba ignava TaxID=1746090 RepID=A0A9Q0L5R5_ANAIG|nr:hypothetical protein M0811_03156 [Anaeramoeba ignava]